MSEVFISTQEHLQPTAKDYAEMELKSAQSWYMNDRDRPFEAFKSIYSAGEDIVPTAPLSFDEMKDTTTLAARRILGGNMSVAPTLGPQTIGHEAKVRDAENNVKAFSETIGIRPGSMRVLKARQAEHNEPDALRPLDLDDYDRRHGITPESDAPVGLEEISDFLYTYNPNIAMAARPADCPILYASAETPTGTIYILVHFSWRGVANGYIEKTDEILDELGVDRSTLKGYLTPGAHAENFRYENVEDPRKVFPNTPGLFANVHKEDDQFVYGIDTPLYAYNSVVEKIARGDSYKIFADTTDTGSVKAGQSSHNFNFNFDNQNNTRDLVAMIPALMEAAPEKIVPPEILAQIEPVDVRYVNYQGETEEKTIEINREVAGDVKAFFDKAYELKFPIFNVARAKDFYFNDDSMMDKNASSGFNYRLIKGTDRPSLHSLGRAFDINPRVNPYIRYKDDESVEVDPPGATYDPNIPGALYADHPLVSFMKDLGWEWGGDWPPESGRTDYQHFQKPLPKE